jgi:hypothetical protein
VHLGIAYDIAEESFPFYHTEKPFSIFKIPKTSFFVKQAPN